MVASETFIILAISDCLRLQSNRFLRICSNKRNIARDLSIYLARDNSGMSCEELGKHFGGISGAGITMRYNNFCNELAGNRKLRNNVRTIKSRIMIN